VVKNAANTAAAYADERRRSRTLKTLSHFPPEYSANPAGSGRRWLRAEQQDRKFDFNQAPVKLWANRMKTFLPLSRSFYEPSARVVARRLLGHFLVRNTPDGFCGGAIVETEAYLSGDPACHGAPGPTARNRVMFGPPGHAYVYLIYGFHFCVNAVCRPPGIAEAILIRAVEVAFGEDRMRLQRAAMKTAQLTNGPGKLCEAMNITRGLDGIDLCDARSPLFIAENPEARKLRRSRGPTVTTTRIGITKAAALPLRFYLAGSNFVSRR
jgi:DNA-3-methyladenine glycosylase